MSWYHGSPNRITNRVIRPTASNREADRKHSRSVVFITPDIRLALQYAGRTGHLYQVAPAEIPVKYHDPDGIKIIREESYTTSRARIVRAWEINKHRNCPAKLRAIDAREKEEEK